MAREQEAIHKMQEYLFKHKLSYDHPLPHSDSKAPWMLSEDVFSLTARERIFFQANSSGSFPEVIGDYCKIVRGVLRHIWGEGQNKQSYAFFETLGEILEKTYSSFRIDSIKKELSFINHSTNDLPFSIRPDCVFTQALRGRTPKIIEYNADGCADKGFTVGVNFYTSQILDVQPIGYGLVKAFVEGIAEYYCANIDELNVLTILPSNYRSEYDLQNKYFARIADRIGKTSKKTVGWFAEKIENITITSDGLLYLLPQNGDSGRHIHIVDREFKMPEYKRNISFELEMQVTRAYLQSKIAFLGSLLPYSDKIFFSLLFNASLEEFILQSLEGTSVERQQRLAHLRSYHAETHLLLPNIEEYRFGGQTFSWQEILNQKIHVVIKKVGDTENTTGSKGVYLSTETNLNQWRKILYEARQSGTWIIQRFHASDTYRISGKRSYREITKINDNSKIRFAPFYVLSADYNYMLGNALVTAGIYPKQKRKRFSIDNIHTSRGTAYLAVAVDRDGASLNLG